MRLPLSLFAPAAAALLLASAQAETLTLAECLQEVARNNPGLEEQRASIRAALGTELTLRSRALPRLSVGLLAGQQGDEGTSFSRVGTIDNVRFTERSIDRGSRLIAIGSGLFLQPLFDVAIPASWRRGSLEVAIARQNFIATADAQLHEARTVFYRALYARENGRLLGELTGRLDANAKATGDLVKAGLANRQGFLQAQVQRSNYEPVVLEAAGSYETSIATLWRLMGRENRGEGPDPLRRVTLGGSLAEEPPAFDAAAAAPLALEQRPDLEALRQVVRAYREDARIVRAGYYPNVDIIINGQALPQNFVRSERPNALRAGDEISTNQVRFGGRFSWDVIDTGAVRGAAQRVDRLRETIETSLHHLEQDVPRDLVVLKAQSDKLRAQSETYRGNLTTARDNLHIVTDAVAQGSSSQLEAIDAESGALNTEIGLLSVRLQMSLAAAEFDRITGGYVRWIVEQSPAASGAGSQTAKDR